MASILEKAISILAENLSSGRSYLITAVTVLLSIPINKLPWFKPSGTDLPENTDSGLNEPISMSDAILKVQLKPVNDIQPRKIGMIKGYC